MTAELIQTASLAVATVALLANAIFSYLRYKHDKSSRNISATMKLVEEWRSEKARAAKDKIVNLLRQKCEPSLGYRNLPSEYKSEVVMISHLCDEIATRVIYGEADEQLVLAFLGSRISSLWDTLEPYIENERKFAGMGHYQAYFQALAAKAKATNLETITRHRIARFQK